MKAFILGLFALMVAGPALADQASVRLNNVSGRLVARNGLQIEDVTLKLGLSFCWGFCPTTPANTKDLNIKKQINPTGTDVLFVIPQSEMYSQESLLGRFGFCSLVIEVTAKSISGELIKSKANIETSENRNVCEDSSLMTELVSAKLRETFIVEMKQEGTGLSIVPVSQTSIVLRAVSCVEATEERIRLSAIFQNVGSSQMAVSLSVPTDDSGVEFYKGKCVKVAGADGPAYRCNAKVSSAEGFEVLLASDGSPKMTMSIRKYVGHEQGETQVIACR